ncbi:MAG: T9SS type A sorting domain-containing protein [Ferruginibacter sp.]
MVYPNPTMGAMQLNISNGSSLKQVFISDIYGRIVKRLDSSATINLSGLGKGSYIIQMIKTNGERVCNKVVVN